MVSGSGVKLSDAKFKLISGHSYACGNNRIRQREDGRPLRIMDNYKEVMHGT
jgi:hypothetical protein